MAFRRVTEKKSRNFIFVFCSALEVIYRWIYPLRFFMAAAHSRKIKWQKTSRTDLVLRANEITDYIL